MGLRLGRVPLAVTLFWCLVALLSALPPDLIDAAASSDNATDIVGLPALPPSGAIDVRSQDASARLSIAIAAVLVVSDGPVAAPSLPRPPPGI